MLTMQVFAQKADKPQFMLPDEKETPRLTKWMNYKYGLFIHFNINTYLPHGQHPKKLVPLSDYKPVNLDVDSWIKLAKDSGMKYAVLTVKHDGGFCLWDSKVTWKGKEFEYDVASTKYKTDVVQAFVDACKKYEIAPGFYYCLADPHAAKINPYNQFNQGKLKDDVFELTKAHLLELIAKYPSCEYYWIDVPRGATYEQQGAIYDTIRRAKSEAIVLMNHHLGKHSTAAEQNLFEIFEKHENGRKAYPVDILNSEAAHMLPSGPVSHLQKWKNKSFYMPYEHCSIAGRGGWFKSKAPHATSNLFELYKKVRLNGGNLLLNVGPRPDGTLPDGYERTFKALKVQIDQFESEQEKDKKAEEK